MFSKSRGIGSGGIEWDDAPALTADSDDIII